MKVSDIQVSAEYALSTNHRSHHFNAAIAHTEKDAAAGVLLCFRGVGVVAWGQAAAER